VYTGSLWNSNFLNVSNNQVIIDKNFFQLHNATLLIGNGIIEVKGNATICGIIIIVVSIVNGTVPPKQLLINVTGSLFF